MWLRRGHIGVHRGRRNLLYRMLRSCEERRILRMRLGRMRILMVALDNIWGLLGDGGRLGDSVVLLEYFFHLVSFFGCHFGCCCGN